MTNSGGSFAGNSNLTFDPTTNTLKTITYSGSYAQVDYIRTTNSITGVSTGTLVNATTFSGTTANLGTVNSTNSNTGTYSGSHYRPCLR